MASKPKLGLNSLVSQSTASPDDLLLSPTPIVKAPRVEKASDVPITTKTRFTNVVPTETFVRLHQLSFWSREDMSDIIDAALRAYFENHPDANKVLPEKERVKRKLL